MKTWVFATNNQHKVDEVRQMLRGEVDLLTLKQIGFHKEIIEDADSFSGNAELKARAVFEATGKPCVADDSGLCVRALNNRPGVKSARYANDNGPVDHSANNRKLLNELKNHSDRGAYFITVLCYINEKGEASFYEGWVTGNIGDEIQGEHGFGYDPLFIPDGYLQTFAELGEEVKNSMSHRARAFQELLLDIKTK